MEAVKCKPAVRTRCYRCRSRRGLSRVAGRAVCPDCPLPVELIPTCPCGTPLADDRQGGRCCPTCVAFTFADPRKGVV